MPTSAPWASAGLVFWHALHLPSFTSHTFPSLFHLSASHPGMGMHAQGCPPSLLQSLSLLMAHEVDGPLIYKASRMASQGGLCRAFSQSWATEAAP